MNVIHIEEVNPNLDNFVKSIRDIGYSTQIAVADIIDNSIAAKAKNIDIVAVTIPYMTLAILDDGLGMNEEELKEAMRLATKSPDDIRNKDDLGRFGLGLKTASFSQCKTLTVISKKNDQLFLRQWDLDYLAKENRWLLITPDESDYEDFPLYKKLAKQKNGTLVIWENIDGFTEEALAHTIDSLRNHLSLVFHRFLEGRGRLNIEVNQNKLEPLNPFNINHPSTQQLSAEQIKFKGGTVQVQPFILPHHSKVTPLEYERYGTEEGYTKAQGFYLYRSNRLLIHGTWWGIHKAIDAHKLVRIKIDIPNDQDKFWQIDIKKSSASPVNELKADLKRIIKQSTEIGSRPYTGRGRKIEDKSTTRFWELSSVGGKIAFSINQQHPLLVLLKSKVENEELLNVLDLYLNGLQAYLPLEAIQAQLQQNPQNIDQRNIMKEQDATYIFDKLNTLDIDPGFIASLLKSEMFKGREF